MTSPNEALEGELERNAELNWILYVWTANFGRGVSVPTFRANAAKVMEADHEASAAYGIQELDEADVPNEHADTKAMSEGAHLIGWGTLNPIIVAKRYRVRAERVKKSSRGVPHLSPARQIVSCRVDLKEKTAVPPVTLLNNHAPRNDDRLSKAIRDNRIGMQSEVARAWRLQRSYIWTGDMNDGNFPPMLPGEKTAVHSDLDYIRYRSHPKGAQLELMSTGSVNLTIDGHDAHWARFRITRPV